jgi:hypothetical protein
LTRSGIVGLGVAISLVACARTEVVSEPDRSALAGRQIDPPAPAGAFGPGLSTADGEALLTWWEPLPAPEGERAHRLMFARYDGTWSEPSVVTQGDDYFANWADVPSAIREPRGSLLVFWLAKTDSPTFAYSIFLARSEDEGASWRPLGRLNDDDTHTEHGFVSLVPEGEAVRAFWLDGRQMADEGPMTVRSALITGEIGASELLDDRVCECCPTAAVATPEGSIVLYRNRSEDETREIYAVRRSSDGWSEPAPVTADGWQIQGCPVNGPAIDARGDATAFAWFTGIEGAVRVSAAFGSEDGSTFGRPVVVDDAGPVGRVGLVLDETGDALVSWLGVAGGEGVVRLRRLTAGGEAGEPLALGRTSAGRTSGVPRLGRLEDRLLVAWIEVAEGLPPEIRMRELRTSDVP